MKRALMVVLLVNLMLSACTPVTAPTPAPSATQSPTVTPTLPPTPTVTPTATPTPIPTLPPEQVGGLSGVPDPRITNPELFDLTRPDAPIPQFVNAMKKAGIEITGEQVLEGLRFEHRRYPVRDENGNVIEGEMKNLVFGVWNLPEEMLPERYQDLAGEIPILVAEKNPNDEWDWLKYSEVPLRIFADAMGIYIGTNDEALDRSLSSKIPTHFNFLYPPWSFRWSENQPVQGVRNNIGIGKINFAKQYKMKILGGVIISDYPRWLTDGNFTNRQLEELLRGRVRDVMSQFQDYIKHWIITNEVGSSWNRSDFLAQRLGEYRLIEIVFDEARKTNPNAVLIFNDSVNHSPPSPRNGGYSELLKDIEMIRFLKQNGLIDALGMQMHLNTNQWNPMPIREDFEEALQICKKIGINVYLTEMDVSLYNYLENDRFLYQAWIYKDFIRTYLASGAGGETPIISFWGLRDNESWLETWGDNKNPNADPLLFDDNGRAKMSYYAILSLLYEKANESVSSNP